MDIGVLATVVVALAGILVAYHIAFRQGGFRRPRPEVRFGAIPGKRVPKQPWVVLVAIPDRRASVYFLELPITIRVGRVSLRHVWLQVAYKKGRHATDVGEMFKGDSKFRSVHYGDFTMAEFEFPLLRRDDDVVAVDAVAWKNHELEAGRWKNASKELLERMQGFRWTADRFTLTMRADNHPEMSFSGWLGAFTYTNSEQVDDVVAAISLELMRREGIAVRVKSKSPGSRVLVLPGSAKWGAPSGATIQARKEWGYR